MTTVACVFVKGHVPFTSDYVTRLAAMVRRHMDRAYRFVVLTDKHRPNFGPGVDAITIPWANDMNGWWAKVRLFDAKLGLAGRVLYLDLDTLIVSALAPILDFPAEFALVPHEGRFEGRNGLQVVKRFNSSVMVWDANVPRKLFDDWTPAIANRLHGDQDWYGERYPGAERMPIEWFPRLSQIGAAGVIPSEAKVVLAKTPKNAEAEKRWPWFRERWRAA